MKQSCDTRRYTLRGAELARLARQLGYDHLARRLARYPGSIVRHRFARQLARAAAGAHHAPHEAGMCRRTGRLGSDDVMLLTVPDGRRHVIRSARRFDAGGEEAEALFDAVVG
jgi:hypothetical protein